MINVEKVKPTGLFTNYIYKAIPLAFDESMSYYETLCGLLAYLKDTVIPALNNNADAIAEVQELMTQLQNYVDNYFDNLDVQEEINTKLDEMAESGVLEEIMADYLDTRAVFGFDTVADMKLATNLTNGSFARTLGYYSVNDGGAAKYKIRTKTNDDVVDEGSIIAIGTTLVAELINDGEINVNQFGAYGDGTHDDTTSITNALLYVSNNYNDAPSENGYKQYKTLNFLPKKYLLNSVLSFDEYLDNAIINGNGCIILGHGFHFGVKFGLKAKFENLNFYNVDTCFEFDYINRNYQVLLFVNSIYQDCNNVFKINRRSCNVKFENCIFKNSGKAMYLNNIDKVEISNCWFQQRNEQVDDYSSFIEQTGDDEGWIDVHDSMFIPQWEGNNISWFKINKKITCHHNRFSGEVPNQNSIVYTSSDMDNADTSGQRYVVDIHDNPIVNTPSMVILNGIPELLSIRNNGGNEQGKQMIFWDSNLTDLEQKTKLVAKLSSFHLIISGNGFRTFDLKSANIDIPSAYLPSIPVNLYSFIQRTYRSQNYQAQYTIESHTMNGTNTDELRVKLYDLTNYAKRNNLGLSFIIAYRGNTSSTFDAENMIDIITLNQDTSASTLKIVKHTIMGSRTGDYTVTFADGTTSVDTTVTSDPVLVITKVSGRSLNYLEFIPLQLADVLSFGQL